MICFSLVTSFRIVRFCVEAYKRILENLAFLFIFLMITSLPMDYTLYL